MDNQEKSKKPLIIIVGILVFIALSIWGVLIGLYFFNNDDVEKINSSTNHMNNEIEIDVDALISSKDEIANADYTEVLKEMDEENTQIEKEERERRDLKREEGIENLNTLIENSDNVLVSIQPYLKDNDWSVIAVVVSDAWYYSEEFEKERFAEQMSKNVIDIVEKSYLIDSEKRSIVYFFDINGKKLATPKLFGEYKILR